MRRHRFCFFHKRFSEERIRVGADHAKTDRTRNDRRDRQTFDLPVLEDANSIQISLMQIVRMLAAGDMEPKTAGLILYALQTASHNLRRTNFEPVNMHNVVLNPRDVEQTLLGETIWEDEDFETEEDCEDEEEDDPCAKIIAKYKTPPKLQ